MRPNPGISKGINKETIFVSFYSQEEEKGENNEIFIPLRSVTEFLLAVTDWERFQRLSERMNLDGVTQMKHKNQHAWPKSGKILAHKSQWCSSKEQWGETETNPNPQMLTAEEHDSSSAQPWTTNLCSALFNSVRTSSHLTEPGGET